MIVISIIENIITKTIKNKNGEWKMKDNIYLVKFRRLKKKYPKWRKKQIGTVAYKVRYER